MAQITGNTDLRIERAREAGVRRGMEASISVLQQLQRDYQEQGIQIGVATLANAIAVLKALTIEQVEG